MGISVSSSAIATDSSVMSSFGTVFSPSRTTEPALVAVMASAVPESKPRVLTPTIRSWPACSAEVNVSALAVHESPAAADAS